jgi:hypothetical protein
MNQNILLNYFEKVFQHANQPNKQVSNLNDLPIVQFTSFVELECKNNIMRIQINDKIINNNLSMHSKIITPLLSVSFYKVNLNNNDYIVSGKFLRRFLADLSYTNNEFLKMDHRLMQMLETKIKNAKEIEFLYLFGKNTANIKDVTKEAANILMEIDLDLSHISDNISDTLQTLTKKLQNILHISADVLFNALKKVIPEAYAKFITGVGLALSFAVFINIVSKFIINLASNYNGLSLYLPLPFIITGVAISLVATYSELHKLLGDTQDNPVSLKIGLIFACIYVGAYVLAGKLQRNMNINDQTRNLSTALQK